MWEQILILLARVAIENITMKFQKVALSEQFLLPVMRLKKVVL